MTLSSNMNINILLRDLIFHTGKVYHFGAIIMVSFQNLIDFKSGFLIEILNHQQILQKLSRTKIENLTSLKGSSIFLTKSNTDT